LLKDHHFPKMKFAYEMDQPAPAPNLIAIAFAFFQPLTEHSFSLQYFLATHTTPAIDHARDDQPCGFRQRPLLRQ
jgi:hypothetical protein